MLDKLFVPFVGNYPMRDVKDRLRVYTSMSRLQRGIPVKTGGYSKVVVYKPSEVYVMDGNDIVEVIPFSNME